jgi:ABC-type multidrug transport system ATPase subunit
MSWTHPHKLFHPGLYELSQYAFLADQSGLDQALTWNIDDPSMRIVLIELFVQSLILPVLAFYFDHVSGTTDGIKKDYMSIFKRKKTTRQPEAKEASKEESPKTSDVDEMDYYLGYLNGGVQYGNTFKEPKKRISSLDLYLGTSNVISDKLRGMEKEIDSPRKGGANAPISLLLSQSFIENSGSSVICHGVKKVNKDDPSKGIHLPSLAIQEQEIFALVGSAGSGKTTVLRMMQGTLHQSEGVICIEGVDSKDCLPLQVRIGVVSDVDLLWHNLTGMEILMFFLRIKMGYHVNPKKYIDNVVEILDLHSSMSKLVSKYSGGMRRRLSLAIALLGFPDKSMLPSTIFLDEPCINMDPYSRKVLWKALHEVKKTSSIIMATSNVLEAESCDRILVMKQGQAIYLGSPKQMIHKYGGFAWLTFTVTAEHRNKVFKFVNSSFSGCETVHEIGQRILFSVPLEPGTQTIDSIFRKVEKARIESLTILDWSVSNLSLEDVYLNLIEND